MADVTIAVAQMRASTEAADNLDRAEALVRQAAGAGAGLVLTQELLESRYFPQTQVADRLAAARPVAGHPTVARFRDLARELSVVLPVSVFERANNATFNSLVIIDADGQQLGVYRKSHIPDGPGYQEKFYFSPGDSGFQAYDCAVGRIGCAICWDQWFPEAARVMVLKGADILLYPTAIGSEPQDRTINSKPHWQRVMQGHAAANMVAVATANRVGKEIDGASEIEFYGGSFIADQTGAIVAEADDRSDTIASATFDLGAMRAERAAWGLFRDRRPELYRPLLSRDGAE